MKINKDLHFLKLQCQKLKMSRRNRHVYFKNCREDFANNDFIDWHLKSLAGQVSYDSSTVGCELSQIEGISMKKIRIIWGTEPLPSLSQIEGSLDESNGWLEYQNYGRWTSRDKDTIKKR